MGVTSFQKIYGLYSVEHHKVHHLVGPPGEEPGWIQHHQQGLPLVPTGEVSHPLHPRSCHIEQEEGALHLMQTSAEADPRREGEKVLNQSISNFLFGPEKHCV